MRVFVDESGSFSWQRPGWSIVAAVGVCELDRSLDEILARFRDFERSLPQERRSPSGEIKGSVLTDRQLATFVWDVLPRSREPAHVSLVGFDSRGTSRDQVAHFRETLAKGGTRRERRRYAAKGDQRMGQVVDEMAAWIRRRSDEDIGWLLATLAAIGDALTHSVVALLDDSRTFDSTELPRTSRSMVANSPGCPTCSTDPRAYAVSVRSSFGGRS